MRSLTVAVIGGGPAGLFLARLIRLQDPSTEVVVFERNPPDATFGFGVVFSDRTMTEFERADPDSYRRLREVSVRWTDMELRHRGKSIRYGGYGFTAISRRTLLRVLQEQAREVGAELRFRCEVPGVAVGSDVAPTAAPGGATRAVLDADVVAVADGANSATRDAHAAGFGTRIETAGARYIWFGTPAGFERVTFPFVESRFGPFAAHAYPYEPGTSTFIVETDETTWRSAGMDISTAEARAPGRSDLHSKALVEEIFKEHLDGMPLLVNNSKWSAFRVVRNERWSHRNMVLLGDAAHTAHFSVGSGTKMAMEDAIALAAALGDSGTLGEAFRAYERRRRQPVARTQRWADPSMRWWASFGDRLHMEPEQLGFHFLTRTRAISYAGLRRRHASRIDEVESWFTARSPRPAAGRGAVLATGVRLGETVVPNRIATMVPDEGGADQRAAAATLAAAGSGLVVVDWSGPDARPRDVVAWRDTVRRVHGRGPAVLAVVGAEDPAGAEFALAAGMRLIEVALRSPVGHPAWLGRDHGVTVIAGLDCPEEPVWSAAGERFVTSCVGLAHVAGFHLRVREMTAVGWEHALEYAGRLRERSRLPVLLDGPDGWAVDGPDSTEGESWRTRLHAAVLSGRIDIVAALPLAAARIGELRRA